MPGILFITPIEPAATGNGLAMRARGIQAALERQGTVTTVCIPVSQPGRAVNDVRGSRLSDRDHAAAWLSTPKGRALLAGAASLPLRAREASAATTRPLLRGPPFDVVYVFRLYLAGAVLELLDTWSGSSFILDIDEDDAEVLEGIARLQGSQMDEAGRDGSLAEAEQLRQFSRQVLPWFDRIVCSTQEECDDLARRMDLPGIRVRKVRNCLPEPPPAAVFSVPEARSPRALLVGNLSYWPNTDATQWLLAELWPGLLNVSPGLRLDVVGGDVPRSLQDSAPRSVNWHGYVEDLETLYAGATVSLVPLRAGGGSRLKVLESFAHGVPVIATAKAVEGLDVRPEMHFLPAENATEFATQFERLLNRPGLAGDLSSRAQDWVLAEHVHARLFEDLAQVLSDIGL